LTGEDMSGMNDVSFSWQNEIGEILSEEAVLNSSEPGMYFFNVTDLINGCISTDSTMVIDFTAFPIANAGVDIMLACDQETAVLDGSQSQQSTSIVYQWLDDNGAILQESADLTYEVMDIGDYTLVVTDTVNGCQNTDEVNVDFAELIQAEDDEFTVTSGEVLEGTLTDNDIFNENTNWTIRIIDNPVTGEVILNTDGTFSYSVNSGQSEQVSFVYEICPDNCPDNCTTASVVINTLDNGFIVPNAFSPNNDGKNDTWIIPEISTFENNRLMVINRWGSVVFEVENYGNDWQGTNAAGKPLPDGVYYYLIYLDLAEEDVLKGSVTIIR